MNELIFALIDNTDDDTDTNQTITMHKTVPVDMDIWTFHRLCKTFACAMTFPESLVDEIFGPDCWQ